MIDEQALAEMLADLEKISENLREGRYAEGVSFLLNLAASAVAGMAIAVDMRTALSAFEDRVKTAHESLSTPEGVAFIKSGGRITVVKGETNEPVS